MLSYLSFLFILLISSSRSLSLFFTDGTSLSLPSHYSTLGNHPLSSILFKSSLIMSSHSFDGCDINLNNTNVKNKLIIFTGSIPMFPSCNKDPHSTRLSLSLLLQQSGALGLIMEQPDGVFITILSLFSFFFHFFSSCLLRARQTKNLKEKL